MNLGPICLQVRRQMDVGTKSKVNKQGEQGNMKTNNHITALVVAMVVALALSSQAQIYVASTNGGGTIYKFDSTGSALGNFAVSGLSQMAVNRNGQVIAGTAAGGGFR